jgi:hypothetical protein
MHRPDNYSNSFLVFLTFAGLEFHGNNIRTTSLHYVSPHNIR